MVEFGPGNSAGVTCDGERQWRVRDGRRARERRRVHLVGLSRTPGPQTTRLRDHLVCETMDRGLD